MPATCANEERILFLGTLDSLTGQVAREKTKELAQQLAAREAAIAALEERIAKTELEREALAAQPRR